MTFTRRRRAVHVAAAPSPAPFSKLFSSSSPDRCLNTHWKCPGRRVQISRNLQIMFRKVKSDCLDILVKKKLLSEHFEWKYFFKS